MSGAQSSGSHERYGAASGSKVNPSSRYAVGTQSGHDATSTSSTARLHDTTFSGLDDHVESKRAASPGCVEISQAARRPVVMADASDNFIWDTQAMRLHVWRVSKVRYQVPPIHRVLDSLLAQYLVQRMALRVPVQICTQRLLVSPRTCTCLLPAQFSKHSKLRTCKISN